MIERHSARVARPPKAPPSELVRFQLKDWLRVSHSYATAYLLEWGNPGHSPLGAEVQIWSGNAEGWSRSGKGTQNDYYLNGYDETGARGWAVWSHERGVYEILTIEHQARVIAGHLSEIIDYHLAGGGWPDSGLGTVSSYWDGYKPIADPTDGTIPAGYVRLWSPFDSSTQLNPPSYGYTFDMFTAVWMKDLDYKLVEIAPSWHDPSSAPGRYSRAKES